MKTLLSAECFAGAGAALRAAVVPVAGGAAHLDEGAGEAVARHLLPCSGSTQVTTWGLWLLPPESGINWSRNLGCSTIIFSTWACLKLEDLKMYVRSNVKSWQYFFNFVFINLQYKWKCLVTHPLPWSISLSKRVRRISLRSASATENLPRTWSSPALYSPPLEIQKKYKSDGDCHDDQQSHRGEEHYHLPLQHHHQLLDNVNTTPGGTCLKNIFSYFE